jgi:hypothetical protein
MGALMADREPTSDDRGLPDSQVHFCLATLLEICRASIVFSMTNLIELLLLGFIYFLQRVPMLRYHQIWSCYYEQNREV